MVYDLIIIGGGPAGLSAAIYAKRKKLNLKVLAQKIGGEQISAAGKIENYPGIESISGQELIEHFKNQIKKNDIDIEEGKEVIKIKKEKSLFLVELEDGQNYKARAIIIASGKRPRRLNVPGAKKFEGKGVSYCSICDTPLFKNKKVAVIGGGNAGLDSALELTKYAKKIYLLEFGEKIIGDPLTQEKLKKTKKVCFILNAETKKIVGKDFVESLIYKDRKTGKIKELKVSGVFVNIGTEPSFDFAKGFLKLNSKNEIMIDPMTNQTSIKGIFAAGDITNIPFKQIIIAAGEGAKASLFAAKYLEEKKS